MILAHYGFRVSLKRLLQEIPPTNTHGSFSCEIGRVFLRRGFRTEIMSYPDEFVTKHRTMDHSTSGKDVVRRLHEWYEKNIPHLAERLRVGMTEYLDSGGTFVAEPVTLNRIRRAIGSNTGVLLVVKERYMEGTVPTSGWSHFVVPIKMSRSHVWINDPEKGVACYGTDYLMLACYRSDAEALFISPR